jgi:hypothetical protein
MGNDVEREELTPYAIKLLKNELSLHTQELNDLIELDFISLSKIRIKELSLLCEDIKRGIEILTMLKKNQ